ncbi:hypothetical protein DB346_24565 [Verrucomicrobia bacterium LW23]|nr:hypothetical protein DB346_24565 [Verrucomicrobia bacterium LW23]
MITAQTTPTFALPSTTGAEDRAYAIKVLRKIADPVLNALSQNKLRATMPVAPERASWSHLEALGRLIAGMAPWLELGGDASGEGALRTKYLDLALISITHAVDPAAPDYMNFTNGAQRLVDAAFLGHALLRAPSLWRGLSTEAQSNLAAALRATRDQKPGENNWLLFSAMMEAALYHCTGEALDAPMEYAVRRHMEWYKGDGAYGDGAPFHWDYYNSFVIQPMLLDVVDTLRLKGHALGSGYAKVLARARRYAAVQEQMISPEGTFPHLGRSSTYRFGAFQHLSQLALMQQLPAETEPAAVRCALTAVMRRTITAPGTFDADGWLRPGAVGYQPGMAEGYISTGSLYLCAMGLLHLGLPADNKLWTEPARPWTQLRIWNGDADVKASHALKDEVEE